MLYISEETSILHQLVKTLKAQKTSTPTSSGSTSLTSGTISASSTAGTTYTDNELKNLGTPHVDLINFLWACHHQDKEIGIPTTSQLHDDSTIKWEQDSNLAKPEATKPTASASASTVTFGAEPAMTKLAEAVFDGITRIV